MYFINEKAAALSINGNPVSLQKGMPALYRARKCQPGREIIIWRDVNNDIHIETILNDANKIVNAVLLFQKGREYY